mgnify:CR=1 FL=1|tara:strand:+ start:856 stop:2271 length:1416 start_codon:yes stop_codon:yes gene_type:complete
MTVIRPNSVSGINSITAQANEIKVFKSDGTQGGLIIGGANLNATSGISTLLALNVTGNVSIAGTLTYQDVTNVDSLGIGTFRTGINVSGGQLDVGSNIKLGNAGVITATSFVGSGANLTGISGVSVANQADNRLITATGTTDALNGEANLTFSGATLKVNNTSGHSYLKLNSNDSYSGSIYFGDQSDDDAAQIWYDNYQGNGMYLRTSENTPISFYTNGIPRVRIENDGDVGIGTVSPQSGGLTVLRHSEARLQVWANGDGSNGKIALRADGTNTQMGTWSNHDCHLVRNASIQATISSTGISLPAGKGIDFSATSDATGMSSELFDDYERGVHTISVTSSGTNPSVNISSNHNKLYYTKIGGMVHVTGELRWTVSSHGSGDLRISIPFQSDSSSQSNSQGTAQTWNVNWAWRSETRDLFSEVSPGHNFMRFRLGGSNSLNEDFLQAGSSYQQMASGYGVEYQVSLWYRTG